MALVAATLQTALKSFVTAPPTSVADASQKWAQAYFTYALPAQALDATALAALNLKTFQPLAATFLAAMQAQTFLDQLPTNLTTFWMGTPFVGLNNGPVVSIQGTPVLVTAITALKAANTAANRGASALDDLAAAIDAWTKTVIVNLVNPAGAVIPTPLL